MQTEVVITVIERLDLVPSLVYIVPEQNITYYIRRNLAAAVPALPNNVPYSVSVDNRTVAVPIAAKAIVQGKTVGSTIIRLVDKGQRYRIWYDESEVVWRNSSFPLIIR